MRAPLRRIVATIGISVASACSAAAQLPKGDPGAGPYFDLVEGSGLPDAGQLGGLLTVLADVSGDGLPDAAFSELTLDPATWRTDQSRVQFYDNQTGPPSQAITFSPSVHVTHLRKYSDVLVVDLDNDGFRDILLAGGVGRSRVLHNQGFGSYEVVVPEGLPADLGTVAAIDLDRDGLVDVVGGKYLSPFTLQSTGTGLYRIENHGNLSFSTSLIDAASALDVAYLTTLDYDDDGRVDVLAGGQFGARLLRNQADGSFADVTASAGLSVLERPSVSALSVGDVDGDGDIDVVVRGCSNGCRAYLALNDGNGSFSPPDRWGGPSGNPRGRGAELFDADGDGDLDLLGAAGPELFVNDGLGTFEDASEVAFAANLKVAEGIASLGDVDGDGDLDLYVVGSAAFGLASGETVLGGLLANQIGQDRRWLEVELIGDPGGSPPVSSRDAWGARITVDLAGGYKVTRELRAGPTDPHVVHFGFGSSAVADTVTVQWPSGRTHRIDLLVGNRRVRLVESAGCRDPDADGVCRRHDNCLRQPNADQRDTNLDGYGNLCDPDFDNDGDVDLLDQARIDAALGGPLVDPDVDLNGDGAVDGIDREIFALFFEAGGPPGAPGPTGRACAGETNACRTCLDLDGDGQCEDSDSDGVLDAVDNCTEHANPDQDDADLDGYGNRCDPDLDGDGLVGMYDWRALRPSYGTNLGDPLYDPASDFDGNGTIDSADRAIFADFFGEEPGPSALVGLPSL